MSVTTACPPMSLPTAKASFARLSVNCGLSNRSLRYTVLFSLFGTSIPTTDLPGTGASMRMSAAARESLMSSARPTIRLTLTPWAGSSSYRVTTGPQDMLFTVTSTPKLRSVCCSFIAVCRYSSWEPASGFTLPFSSRSTGGYRYSGIASAAADDASAAAFTSPASVSALALSMRSFVRSNSLLMTFPVEVTTVRSGSCGGVFAAALTSNRPLRVFPLSTRTKERAEGMDTAGALEDKASTGHFPVRKRSRMASKQRRWRGVISFHARCSSPRTADSSSIIRWRLSRGTDSPRSIRARQVEHFAETEPYQSSASSHTRCWADAKMDPQKSRRTARYRFKPNTVQR